MLNGKINAHVQSTGSNRKNTSPSEIGHASSSGSGVLKPRWEFGVLYLGRSYPTRPSPMRPPCPGDVGRLEVGAGVPTKTHLHSPLLEIKWGRLLTTHQLRQSKTAYNQHLPLRLAASSGWLKGNTTVSRLGAYPYEVLTQHPAGRPSDSPPGPSAIIRNLG